MRVARRTVSGRAASRGALVATLLMFACTGASSNEPLGGPSIRVRTADCSTRASWFRLDPPLASSVVQGVTSGGEYLIVHDAKPGRVSTAGKRVWSWSLLDLSRARDGKMVIDGRGKVYPKARVLTVVAGLVTFSMGQYLAVLDAETGDEIYVDRAFRTPVWTPDVMTRGERSLVADEPGVWIRDKAGERFIDGGELYACQDDDLAFLVTSTGEIFEVAGDGELRQAGKRRVDGRVIGNYVDEHGKLEAVWTDDEFVYDGHSCWSLEWPDELPARKEYVDPRTAAVTVDGVAIHLYSLASRETRGPLLFFEFDERRDVSSCRRVTHRLVIPN